MTYVEDIHSNSQDKIVCGFDILSAVNDIRHSSSNSIASAYSETAILFVESMRDDSKLKDIIYQQSIYNELDYYVFLNCLERYIRTIEISEYYEVFNKLLSVSKLPLFSNLTGWNSLESIVKYLSIEYFKDCFDIETFNEKFSKIIDISNSLFGKNLYFLIIFKHFQKNDKMLQVISKQFNEFLVKNLSNFKFPKANEVNTKINLLVNTSIYLINKPYGKYIDLYKIIKKYLFVTYQNPSIMKLWCLSSIKLGVKEEIVATFKTYLAYNDDFKMKNNNNYKDLVDIIDTYISVLQYLSPKVANKIDFDQYIQWFKNLENLINIELVQKVVGLEVEFYLSPLIKVLSNYYYKLGIIYENLLLLNNNNFNNSVTLVDKINKSLKFFKQSINLIDNLEEKTEFMSNYYFKTCFYLTKTNDYKESMKQIKNAIKLSPNNISYINLLSILLSGNENTFEKSLKISNETITAILPRISGISNSNDISIFEKRDILQLYMTYIALLDKENDDDGALKSLELFFAIINKLFDNEVMSSSTRLNEKKVTNDDNYNKHYSIRPSIADAEFDPTCCTSNGKEGGNKLKTLLNKKSNGNNSISANNNGNNILTKIKSIRPSSKPAVNHPLKSTNSKYNKDEIKILKNIWLWLSKLMQKFGDYESSTACIEEAEKIVDKKDWEICSRRGILCICLEEYKQALEYLEKSLDLQDYDNAEAVVGLTELSLTKIDTIKSEIFISEDDQKAATSRCQIYLEKLVDTIRYYDDADVWFALSRIYETVGDEEQLIKSLHSVVEAKKRKNVRKVSSLFN